MNYSLSNMLGGGMIGGLDPDAKGYINAVVAAGGTVSGGQKSAINTFYKTGKSEGWYSSLKRMYLPIWGVAAPNALCMTSLTSGTFVGTVTHGAGFITTDALTGHFLYDATPSALGCTTSSGSCIMLVTGASTIAGNAVLGSTQDVSNNTRFGATSGGTGNRAWRVFQSAALSYADSDSRSVLLTSRTSTTTLSAYKRTSSAFTTTINEVASTVGTVGTTTPMTLMANNVAGVVSGYATSATRFGAHGMGLGVTSAQAEGLTLALKNLWETATGLTLP
jgi:hypothetical protein